MNNWFKRISRIGFTVVMVEAVAWVGLTRFGTDGLTAAWQQLQHPNATNAIVTATSSGLEKCSTFNGHLYCIEETTSTHPGRLWTNQRAARPSAATSSV